jgi:hypothetical protein
MGRESSPAVVGLFVAVECAFGFSAFLPSIFTIRHFGAQPATAENIRIGEALGCAWAIALAGIASILVDSVAPLLLTIPTAALIVCVYEWALRHPDGSAEVMA